MVMKVVIASLAVLALLMMDTPVDAHHSANAMFDTQKEFTITGVLTKLENVNPHSWWYVDVKEADGTVTSWKLESLSPSGLIRQGLKVKTDLKIGETFSYRISPAWKDPEGVKMGWMRAITVGGKEFVVIEL
jgi:hypothetical protein